MIVVTRHITTPFIFITTFVLNFDISVSLSLPPTITSNPTLVHPTTTTSTTSDTLITYLPRETPKHASSTTGHTQGARSAVYDSIELDVTTTLENDGAGRIIHIGDTLAAPNDGGEISGDRRSLRRFRNCEL